MANFLVDALNLRPTTLPTVGLPGEVRADSGDDNKLKRWDSVTSTWIEVGSGSGGSGGSILRFQPHYDQPGQEDADAGGRYLVWSSDGLGKFSTNIKVPRDYQAGKNIKVINGKFKTSGTTGKVALTMYVSLVRNNDDLVYNVFNQIAAITVNGTTNRFTQITDQLITSAGQINSMDVAPGDDIAIVLIRDISRETGGAGSATTDIKVLNGSFEVTFDNA